MLLILILQAFDRLARRVAVGGGRLADDLLEDLVKVTTARETGERPHSLHAEIGAHQQLPGAFES